MRVERCFAFVDLCGFTAFTDEHGDDRVVLVLAEFRTILREGAARRGVRVVKWLGDGAMLSSTMIDAVAALVVELDNRMAGVIPSLPLRAGLDSGPVIMFEGDDYIGRPVNAAARLCDTAGPGEILATPRVVGGLPGWMEAGGPDPVAVRGLSEPLEVRLLSLARAVTDPVTDPVCGLTINSSLTIGGPDGNRFCSEACADSWADQQRVPATPD